MFAAVGLTLFIAGCQRQEPQPEPVGIAMESKPYNPMRISMADVRERAERVVGTKSGEGFDVSPILNGGDTVMYLVNYASGLV